MKHTPKTVRKSQMKAVHKEKKLRSEIKLHVPKHKMKEHDKVLKSQGVSKRFRGLAKRMNPKSDANVSHMDMHHKRRTAK